MVCVLRFSRTFLGKNAQLQNMCAKKRNDFRQLKRSNFRVEKCKTEENLSKFLNNMAYKTVTSMRDCVMKRKLMLNMNSFYFDKMHMLYNQINHLWSRVKNIAFFLKITHSFPKKNPLFSQKNHCFPTCALFLWYPIVLKLKIITGYIILCDYMITTIIIIIKSCVDMYACFDIFAHLLIIWHSCIIALLILWRPYCK